MARELTQSITVEAEEKLLLDTLALHNRIKPAALARHLLYRGLRDYLHDGNIHSKEQEKEISKDLFRRIDANKELKRAKDIVRKENQARGSGKGKR